MVAPSIRRNLIAGLVAAFALQTILVYGDAREEPLGEAAVRGRVIWHEHACQVCHQLYGMGGFLGPDLTHAASRVGDERLALLLTSGSGQMPAFGMTPREISDVRAYLEALDRPDLGRGQLRMGRPGEGGAPWDRFDRSVEPLLADAEESVRAGLDAFRGRVCRSCHLPLEASPLTGAPDLSLSTGRSSDEELRSVLVSGRPSKGMPPPAPPLSAAERDGLLAFFHWLGANRDAVGSAMEDRRPRSRLRFRDVPWWEYR